MKLFVGLLALATAVSFADAANEPDQLRLAFVPDGMTVSWTTPTALAAAPVVYYGLSPSSLTSTASGSSHSYGTSFFHDVVLSPLQPSSLYYYATAPDANSPASVTYNFTTALAAGDPTPYTLLLVGDMGLANSQNTMNALMAEKDSADFVLHVGDISYADDWYLRGDTYENSWTKWQDKMEPITATMAYMTLPGNHEVTCNEAVPALCPDGQKNMTAYKHRFRMPGPESGGTGNLWFSYDYGLVHFVHINMETDFPNAPSGEGTWLDGGGEPGQLDWLESDLAAAVTNRGKVPWIIAAAHRPLYSSTTGCDACVKAFEALFNKYNVDVFFAGHVHWYERLYAIAPGGKVVDTNYTNPTAPVYIVNGAAGNVEGHTTGNKAPFSAFIYDADYGYGKLSITNSSSLTWQFFRATNKDLIDEITLFKEH